MPAMIEAKAHDVLELFIREQEATAEEAEGHRDGLLRQETPLLGRREHRVARIW